MKELWIREGKQFCQRHTARWEKRITPTLVCLTQPDAPHGLFPSLLWVYFLMAPGGLADKTTCLPHPFRAIQPAHTSFPSLPPNLPLYSYFSTPPAPSTSGALPLSNSLIHVLPNPILPGQLKQLFTENTLWPPHPASSSYRRCHPSPYPTALDSSSLHLHFWSWDFC